MSSSVKCAIYTRRSSEDSYSQPFNSLRTQREACEAYVASQRAEMWTVLKSRYDDNGYTGGNLDRPALRRVLDDIARGLIDVVLVYKIDRLTRSLSDFGKLMEIFGSKNVSFVAVTQHFNTSTSMGRLTLNVLLTFAQFERELAGDRISDKKASLKAKGIWVGGRPPLGYDIVHRKLVINRKEASEVKYIFESYARTGDIGTVLQDLKRRGVKQKKWVARSGKRYGGVPFTHKTILTLLKRRLYLGEVNVRGKSYPNTHERLISNETWSEVQRKLEKAEEDRRIRRAWRDAWLLHGLLVDDRGNSMRVVREFDRDRNSAHHYYLSTAKYHYFRSKSNSMCGTVGQSPADTVDRVLLENLLPALNKDLNDRFEGSNHLGKREILASIIKHVELRADGLRIFMFDVADVFVDRSRFARTRLGSDKNDRTLLLVAPYKFLKEKHTAEIHTAIGKPYRRSRIDQELVRALATAYSWRRRLVQNRPKSIEQIATAQGCSPSHVRRLLPLAFLAPDIMQKIIEGNQPAQLSLDKLLKTRIPLEWEKQRRLFGFTDQC